MDLMGGIGLMYVAAPYSDPDPAIVKGRMAVFDEVVADLLRRQNYFPISPLLNHPIVAQHTVPGDWEFWQHYSRRLLGRSDILGIIQLPGWEKSAGVSGEREFARTLSLPVLCLSWNRETYRRGVVSALAEEFNLPVRHVDDVVDRSIMTLDVEAARSQLSTSFSTRM